MQYGLLPVVAIAIIAHAGRLEEADLVIVMQGAGRDARQFGELFYSEHDATINPDVTLMSRGCKRIFEADKRMRGWKNG
jgi:hypothetical protein